MHSSTNAYSSFDRILLMASVLLLCWGILSVTSASYFMSLHTHHWGEYFVVRQLVHGLLALLAAYIVYLIPTQIWQQLAPFILLAVLIMLVAVLIPGIGKTVNGSHRWLQIVGFNIQVSEVAKLSLIMYLASYISRKQYQLQNEFMGVAVPCLAIGCVGLLIMLEPDFGGLFLVSTIGFSMLFFGGLCWRYVLGIFAFSCSVFVTLAVAAPYRLARITSFFNPWDNPYGDSYQLTQSLMAIGKGGIFGSGLGYGLQKQLYLPESHTDFIYAVIAEESGFIGCMFLISLFILLLSRCALWTYRAARLNKTFEAMMIYGIMVYWGCSILFSISVNLGLVPTKGIALPFISYGGSNLLVNACAVGMLLRMTKELAQE